MIYILTLLILGLMQVTPPDLGMGIFATVSVVLGIVICGWFLWLLVVNPQIFPRIESMILHHPVRKWLMAYFGLVLISILWVQHPDVAAWFAFRKAWLDVITAVVIFILYLVRPKLQVGNWLLVGYIIGSVMLNIAALVAGPSLSDRFEVFGLVNSTYLGQVLSTGGIFCLYFLNITRQPILRCLLLVALLSNFYITLLTISKISLTAYITSILLFMILCKLTWRQWAAICTGLGAIALIAWPKINGYLAFYYSHSWMFGSLSGRTSIWQVGMEGFLASPIWGQGVGALWGYLINIGSSDLYSSLHNEMLHIAFHYGLIGLFLWAMIMYSFFIQGKRLLADPDRNNRMKGALCLSLLVFFLIKGFAEANTTFLLLRPWLLMGLSTWYLFPSKQRWFKQPLKQIEHV